MRKFLLTFFAALISCFAFPTLGKAEMTITWNWDVLSGCIIGSDPIAYPLGASFSNGGITLTANNGHISNDYGYRRMYPDTDPDGNDPDYGAEFTFSCANANITRIEMTCSSTPYNSHVVAEGWSITSPGVVWSGSPASSVIFGRYSGDVTQIVITTDGVINEDMLTGVFSVSPCTSVKFSKGNLQYRASDHSWQFANNQYDIIGNNPGNNNSSNSRNTQSAWVDLFGWGTGDDPTKVYGGSYNSFTEWGSQFDAQTGWRTLTYDEWRYLLDGRYGYPSTGISYAKGIVNGVTGLIVLPDDWSDSYYHLNYPNDGQASCSSNVITQSDWTTSLEAHGAVFLPATGVINNTYMQVTTGDFNYWTSTAGQQYSDRAYALLFDYYSRLTYYEAERRLGMAVRLVSNYIVKPAATISSDPTAKTGLVYNGNYQSLVNTGITNDGRFLYSTYSDLRSPTTSSPGGYDAGTYHVYYMVQGDDDHCDYIPENNHITITINKANPTVTAPTPKTLYYTGEAQALVNAGSTTGGTLQYKLGNDGSWGNNLPQATDPGNYTVYYKVNGNTNYNAVAEASVSVTIAPKTNYDEEDSNIETYLAALSDPTNLTINRTIYKDGYYNTICLPVDMSAAEISASDLAGCELFAFDDASVSGSILSLFISPADAIEAGVPYLIKWPNTGADAQDITLSFSDIAIGATAGSRVGDGSVQFVGTIGRTELPVDEDYLFVGANNTLHWSNNDGTIMKAFRAYFIVGSDPVISPRQTPARLVIRPKTPTAIESIESSAFGIQKVIRNGKLIIIRNGLEYDAQGQKLK